MKYRLVVYTSPTDMLEPMPLAAFDGPAYTAWLAGWLAGLAYIRFFEVGGDAYAIARCLNRGMVIG